MSHPSLAVLAHTGRRLARALVWVLAAAVLFAMPYPAAFADASTADAAACQLAAGCDDADPAAPDCPHDAEGDEEDEGESAPELSDDVMSHDEDSSGFRSADRVHPSIDGAARAGFCSRLPRPSGRS